MSKGDPRFHRALSELGELHDRKQQDYGRDDDPFANVRGAQEWGVPSWLGAMIRCQDKIRRLQQYARKGTLANESVRDSFLDLAVYAVIACILWEEEQYPLILVDGFKEPPPGASGDVITDEDPRSLGELMGTARALDGYDGPLEAHCYDGPVNGGSRS